MIGSPAMSGSRPDASDVRPARARVSIALAVAITLPAVGYQLVHPDLEHALAALIFGLAIVGAAFLLSWAAEVAQLDISAGLAIAILALIAVLPEYAVDFVFAWKGGQSFAATGAACLPIDGGTRVTVLARAREHDRREPAVDRHRLDDGRLRRPSTGCGRPGSSARAGRAGPACVLDREHSIEISYLAVATIYSLSLPLKHSITLVDAAVLVTIFVLYTIRVSRAPAEEPHLVGPARYLGTFGDTKRRAAIIDDVRRGGRRDPAVRRVVRRGPRGHRRDLRGERVPVGAVDRAARLRGARAARGRPLRLAPELERRRSGRSSPRR